MLVIRLDLDHYTKLLDRQQRLVRIQVADPEVEPRLQEQVVPLGVVFQNALQLANRLVELLLEEVLARLLDLLFQSPLFVVTGLRHVEVLVRP